jgi:hypothetical protein
MSVYTVSCSTHDICNAVFGTPASLGGAATSDSPYAKPLDRYTDRRARRQPTVPSTCKEMPFVETAAKPVLFIAALCIGVVTTSPKTANLLTSPIFPRSL